MAGPGFAGQHQDAGRRQGQAPTPAGISDAPLWSVVGVVVSGRLQPAPPSLGSRGPWGARRAKGSPGYGQG